MIDVNEIIQQTRAEVLAAFVQLVADERQRWGPSGDGNVDGALHVLYEDAKKLQPAANTLEEYVKNLPLSEIARIKGIPGVARLGKTYDRPDFYATEDE